MFNDVIYLINETETTDSYGDATITTTEKQVFAEVKSISQNEFYQAQGIGLKPEIKFVIADFADYGGQMKVKYTPFGGTVQVYDVLRTFRNKINLEIVCKRGID